MALFLASAAQSGLCGQDTTAVPASLLRVLAEAADVHRTGRPVFLVADRRFPHHVIGHLDSRPKALQMQSDSGASYYGVFGPFVTPADSAPSDAMKLTSVRLTFKTAKGATQTKDIDPKQVDALFMSMSAVDKFMIPYYAQIYGPDYAARLRDDVSVAYKVPVIGHRLSVGDSLRIGGGPILPLEPSKPPR
jgi:hypothetical protein